MDFSKEIQFKTARSGGKGGQHVNKVETMVEAYWNPRASEYFTEEQKILISTKLASRINKEGYVLVRCAATRSQLENKQLAVVRLHQLVTESLVVKTPRIATKASKGSMERRLENKKRNALLKAQRRKSSWD